MDQRAKAEKRRHILEAAISVFARKGFYHAKISEIAQAAGVADGTIYLYFKNKDDLLISIFEEEMDRIIARFREVIEAEPDPERKLRAFVRQHARMVLEHPDLAHVLQVELRQSSIFMSDYRPVKLHEFLSLIEGIVREGQAQGIFRDDLHPGMVKRAIFGALDELALHWILNRGRWDLEESARQLERLLLEGLTVATERATYRSAATP